jgi:hypothetical protein
MEADQPNNEADETRGCCGRISADGSLNCGRLARCGLCGSHDLTRGGAIIGQDSPMPTYVRHTEAVQPNELPAQISDKLTEHAESRQIELSNVRVWLTHSENPLASSGFGKMLRRRANPSDPDAEHRTALVLHPTQILVVIDGAKRGTSVVSLPLAQASMAPGLGVNATLNSEAVDPAGFTLTGFEGEQTGSFYIGLGPEAAAAECISAVRSAITVAKL